MENSSSAASDDSSTAPRGFFDWLRSLGITRNPERWLAGVAAGLANRVGLDPLIVRGIFVVLALLGGPGLLAYGLGWLLLPDRDGRIHLEDVFRGRAEPWVITVAVIGTAVFLLPILLGLSSAPFSGMLMWDAWFVPDPLRVLFQVLTWIVIIGGGIWFIIWFSTRSQTPAGPHTTEQPRPSEESRAAGSPTDFGHKAAAWGEEMGARSAAWGERLNERTEAWTARHQALQRERMPSAGYVILTLAVALLAGGASALWTYGIGGLDSTGFEAPQLALLLGILSATVVLAGSMIIAGARGKNTGWVGFFAAGGVVALLLVSVVPQGTSVTVLGTHEVDLHTEPAGVAMFAGTTYLDLTELDNAPHVSASVSTSPSTTAIWLLAGTTHITLPEERPVIVDIGVAAGNARVSTADHTSLNASGPLINRQIRANTTGVADADIAHVEVRVAFGNVQVSGAPGTLVAQQWEESR